MRVAWGSRPPCSIVVAGYACSHPFMVFNRIVSLLAVDLVVVGSLENTCLVGVFRLSCVWIEVHSSSTCCWVSSVWPHPPGKFDPLYGFGEFRGGASSTQFRPPPVLRITVPVQDKTYAVFCIVLTSKYLYFQKLMIHDLRIKEVTGMFWFR